MDTLALLCTLHADGPASLQRLRAAELYSIDDVLGCSVETTADVLGLSMAQARRFHREARMLAMRMHTEGLDREERMYPGSMAMEALVPRATPEKTPLTQSTAPTPEPPTPTPPTPAPTMPMSEAPPLTAPATCASGTEDMRMKPDIASILAPVLERWEGENEETTPTEPESMTTAPSTDETDVTQVEAGDLEGVDESLRDALRAAGYATLTAMAEVEPLELSRATGRTYSEACRVRFLAQRAMEGRGRAEASVAPETETMSMQSNEHISVFEGSSPPEVYDSEPEEEPPTPDACAQSEAERVLAELSGNVEAVTDRFSPAPPERQCPEETPAEESPAEEGPGGPFA